MVRQLAAIAIASTCLAITTARAQSVIAPTSAPILPVAPTELPLEQHNYVVIAPGDSVILHLAGQPSAFHIDNPEAGISAEIIDQTVALMAKPDSAAVRNRISRVYVTDAQNKILYDHYVFVGRKISIYYGATVAPFIYDCPQWTGRMADTGKKEAPCSYNDQESGHVEQAPTTVRSGRE